MKIYYFIRILLHAFFIFLTLPIVDGWYGGFWKLRKVVKAKGDKCNCTIKRKLLRNYMEVLRFQIGINTKFKSIPPIFPHGMSGIFISDMAEIGENVVIFQQVTIGSNTIKNHKKNGAPKIGDNVYIGAGAKIIGNVKIGDNCRIGANCVVVKDMSPNTTAVAAPTRFIQNDSTLDNVFVAISDYRNQIDSRDNVN